MKIFIVIVNYNRVKEITNCLLSLQKLVTKNWQVKTIVVDNGSQDNSAQIIKKKFPKIFLIENEKNLGFVGGNNVGIKEALRRNVDYVMLLNNDTMVDKNLLVHLVPVLEESKELGIAAPKIYFAAGFEYHKDRYTAKQKGKIIWYAGGSIDWANITGVHEGLDEPDEGQFNQRKEIEFASGCCMLIKNLVFKKIQLLDERYFLYLEDMDYCVRTKRAGFKLLFVPQAIIWHKNLGTDKQSVLGRQAYFYTRNRLLFGLKYASFRTKVALIKESLKFFYKGNKWQKKGVIDFYLNKFGSGSFQE